MSVRYSWLVAFALMAWFGSSARAQGVVPGGWAPQVGYQVFGGAGAVAFGAYGPGALGWGASPFGAGVGYGGGMSPFGPASTLYGPGFPQAGHLGTTIGVAAPPPSTVNAMAPLIGSVRQATRRPRR
jgi:hypothetical protein